MLQILMYATSLACVYSGGGSQAVGTDRSLLVSGSLAPTGGEGWGEGDLIGYVKDVFIKTTHSANSREITCSSFGPWAP